MSTIEDLKSVLNEALENRGIASEVKAKLRAEVYNILEDNASPKPSVSQENLLINELIREYMEFNRYRYSKSVFLKANQPATPLSRDIIAAELHVKEDKTSKQVPLIYSLLWHFLNNVEMPDNHDKDTSSRETSEWIKENGTSSNSNNNNKIGGGGSYYNNNKNSNNNNNGSGNSSEKTKINIYKYNSNHLE